MAKVKRPFLSGYKTYAPEVEGYGKPQQWREAFRARMGLDEARQTLGARSPEDVLGVAAGAAWEAIKRAYRQRSFECHPDRAAIHGLAPDVATERFKDLLAAYVLLQAKYGKT